MIEFDGVTKSYAGKKALDRISLNLEESRIYCLLGRNGAGKTTLMKCIAGHISPSSGTVKVDGRSVSTLYMPECVNFIENRAAQFNLRVGELIDLAKSLQDDFDGDFAQSALAKFKLDKKKKYRELSFGMQTMVTTLLSLANNSKVVLLDEPVLGFDAIMRSRLYELLSDSFENHRRLIIISTHLIDEIAKTAQELMILDAGRIIFRSSLDDLDERAYSVTGMTRDVESAISGLNVIGRKIVGGFTTAFVYDSRPEFPPALTVQALGLQDFFISMVGGYSDERQ